MTGRSCLTDLYNHRLHPRQCCPETKAQTRNDRQPLVPDLGGGTDANGAVAATAAIAAAGAAAAAVVVADYVAAAVGAAGVGVGGIGGAVAAAGFGGVCSAACVGARSMVWSWKSRVPGPKC